MTSNARQHTAYLGLGSNLGNSQAMLARAVDALKGLPESHVITCSSIYHSPAWGVTDQPDFTNAVIALSTRLDPLALLTRTQELEKMLGRTPTRRWGERLIDIDILLYDQHLVSTPQLRVPHPYLHQRAFVLLPLLEIAPDISIPGLGLARDLWHQLRTSTSQTIRKNGQILW